MQVFHTPIPTGGIRSSYRNLDYTFEVTNPVNVDTAYWNFGDGNTAMGMQVQHTYARPGIYDVRLSLSGSCDEIWGHNALRVVAQDRGNSLTESSFGARVQVYPNPFTQTFHIKVEDAMSHEYYLLVTDVLGRKVLQVKGNISDLNNLLNKQTTTWANGLYILELTEQATGHKGVLQVVKQQ